MLRNTKPTSPIEMKGNQIRSTWSGEGPPKKNKPTKPVLRGNPIFSDLQPVFLYRPKQSQKRHRQLEALILKI